MPQVKYTGQANTRTISSSSWKKAGVEDQGDTVWSKNNGFVAEVSDSAAKYLTSRTPKGPFQLVEQVPPENTTNDDDMSISAPKRFNV